MDDCFVACVVVTYNRLDCLKQCLQALRMQSRKTFDIIVVNNGSTDGTKDFLDSQKNIITIHQQNLGGAGGFYAGMKYMMEHEKYTHLWLMDDDGIPDEDELNNLLIGMDEHSLGYANALAIDVVSKSKTCAGENLELISKESTLHGHLYPFNGALYKRSVIEKVGLIKKEMFIWGDEREYTLRLKKNGVKCGSITNAIHYHPLFKGDFTYAIPFISVGKIAVKPEPRDKYYYRNLGYLDKTYQCGFGKKYVLYYVLRLKFIRLMRFLRFYILGYKNRYDVEI
ncbi:glycosyltransferase [Candidatus Saccharibacteria bacterium]|nr:glycosyltransferase [Candidatus Saccharibacteria bacterium]